MGKALYRKYRPTLLSEIIGQEHITETLEHALKQNAVSHAYLLTGPRGVGKTSIARILAYEVNGLPYDEEGTHLDIIEIDAASNRRIDEIRELKERVNIAPTSAKYKVYIIDEVHMLTKEAFNALLKTLEEPPEHAIFILATTEAHKVPATIISRTQRFTLKPIGMPQVIAHLKDLAKKEKITIDDEALALVAAHGEGSFRDSISLLDQIGQRSGKITLADVQQGIGQAPTELLDRLLAAMNGHDIKAVGQALAALRVQGVQAVQIARQLSQLLRAQLLEQTASLPAASTLRLLSDLLHVPAASDPGIALELAIYGITLQGTSSGQQATATEHAQIPKPKVQTPEQDQSAKAKEPEASKAPAQNPQPAPRTPSEPSQLDSETWQEVLAAIKGTHNTLYGIARMATPAFETDKLTLSFGFAFHQKRLEAQKKVLLEVIYQTTGLLIEVECVLEPGLGNVAADIILKPEVQPPSSLNLETISNIFGGAEIVE
jgi:DNA polymerase-3 subunit gamma/tau